jgi:acyl-coenzyme A thioesterase PaaI-like protein
MSSEYSRRWTNRLPVWVLKCIFNIYPPYLGTGIHVKTITSDFKLVEVVMRMRWYNKNYVGTHFGGSIFSMADPFPMLMLMKNLGDDYIVWDKAAKIEFKKPGKGTLKVLFRYSDEDIQTIRDQVEKNRTYIFDRSSDIHNEDGETIATVIKTLYVRKRS